LSSFVEITDDQEVLEVGRQVIDKLAFSGVIKLDFKRDRRDERLYLLEANPRFSLWHHPAALAGVNLAALYYQDCVVPGSARPPGPARPGVRWMSTRADLKALREYRAAGELSIGRWLYEWLTADVSEDFTWRDPLPGLYEALGTVQRLVRPMWPWRLEVD
jgi:predicted ATP-grasp superfamily ATP-dependent carboligase